LLPPSAEQQVAVDTLLHTKNNIVIEACAGAGKTTTVLHLAQAAPQIKFLLLVYNRRLLEETEQRVKDLGLENITVLNYHALGVRYYTSECATDQGLKRVVQDDMLPSTTKPLPDFSVLIMDEQQDMTPILKRFVDKLIRDKGFVSKDRVPCEQGPQLRLVLLGDSRQAIYDYTNADPRFLSMAARDEVFGYVNDQQWTYAPQTTSYRATQPIVKFVNQQLLKSSSENVMHAVKRNDKNGSPFAKPRYVICDSYTQVLGEVIRLLEFSGLSAADILVVAPSVRKGSPAISLANGLALRRIPVSRNDSDLGDIDPAVYYGKVLICSYHQAKGIERKACIVLGCDHGYYDIYAKGVQGREAVTNAQYVAATRALEHLVLIHDHKHAYLPFIDETILHKTCDVQGRLKTDVQAATPKSRPFAVTSLCRNLSESLMTACLHCLELHNIAEPAFPAATLPSTILNRDGLHEDVSAITGTAVPAIYQNFTSKLPLVRRLKRVIRSVTSESRPKALDLLPIEYYDKVQSIVLLSKERPLSTSGILFLSALEMAEKDGDITSLLNIPLDKYTWLPETYAKVTKYVLSGLPTFATLTGRGLRYECRKVRGFPEISRAAGTEGAGTTEVKVTGVMDVCQLTSDATKVWEIKHMDDLAPEHLIQVAVYMMLLGPDTSGFLVSARTGQTVQVTAKKEGSMMEMLQLLVNEKSGGELYSLLNTYTDDEFLAECRRDFRSLVGDCALPVWFAQRPTKPMFSREDKGEMRSDDKPRSSLRRRIRSSQ